MYQFYVYLVNKTKDYSRILIEFVSDSILDTSDYYFTADIDLDAKDDSNIIRSFSSIDNIVDFFTSNYSVKNKSINESKLSDELSLAIVELLKVHYKKSVKDHTLSIEDEAVYKKFDILLQYQYEIKFDDFYTQSREKIKNYIKDTKEDNNGKHL